MSSGKKLTQEEAKIRILNRCKEKNYELLEPFIFTDVKSTYFTLKCNIDGYIWKSHFRRFLRGDSCPKCSGNSKPTQKEADNKVLEKCKELNYKLLKPFIYNNNLVVLQLQCLNDNYIWKTTYNNLINKNRKCPICANTHRRINNMYTISDILTKFTNIHSNNYDYSLVNYTGIFNKVKIICKKHGTFEQTPDSHINGSGCPKCNSSKGENKIRNFLNENKIDYIEQKTFKECKLKRLLKFDFYLINKNICIEYDGKQHFKIVKTWGGDDSLNLIKIRDEIKNNYCEKYNIKLLRISYTEINNIENILKKELNL